MKKQKSIAYTGRKKQSLETVPEEVQYIGCTVQKL